MAVYSQSIEGMSPDIYTRLDEIFINTVHAMRYDYACDILENQTGLPLGHDENLPTGIAQKYDELSGSSIDEYGKNNIIYNNYMGDNPIAFGGAIGAGGLTGDFGWAGGVGAGMFTGKSAAQKLAMCGVTGMRLPSEVLAAGLIVEHTFPHGAGHAKFNKNVVADLEAIINECAQKISWYTFRISSAFRTSLSAGGKSRHQLGVALDINAGSAGNPWFSRRFTSADPGWQAISRGTTAPWPQKSNHYGGGYDPSRCIWSTDHPVVKIMNGHGWGWGGAYGDVMHFSIDTYNGAGFLAGS